MEGLGHRDLAGRVYQPIDTACDLRDRRPLATRGTPRTQNVTAGHQSRAVPDQSGRECKLVEFGLPGRGPGVELADRLIIESEARSPNGPDSAELFGVDAGRLGFSGGRPRNAF